MQEANAQARAEVQAGRELVSIGGELYSPVVRCGGCGYVSPATWQAPVRCPACSVAVMGEVLMTAREYRDAVNALVASLDTSGNGRPGSASSPRVTTTPACRLSEQGRNGLRPVAA